MSEPYLGEIRMFGGNFAPFGWMLCQGQVLSISDYAALFNLIGTTYGGDGYSTFALPDLASRIPVHRGAGYGLGDRGGAETVSLTVNHLPPHTHQAKASGAPGSQTGPDGNVWAATSRAAYSDGTPNAQLAPTALARTGGNQPHDNMPPYLAVNFIISLFGIYPSPS